jgi:hypothetical protein
MEHDIIQSVLKYKEVISSLQSIGTILGLIIAGIWALRRFHYERPYQGSLEVTINGSLFASNTSANLMHLFIHVRNIGKAAIKIGNSTDISHHSSIKVYAVSGSAKLLPDDINSTSGTINTDLTTSKFSEQIIDLDFVELFKPWFEDRKYAILESGEGETYSLDFAVDKSIGVILVHVTIYETRTNKSLGRPYYWREYAMINCLSDKRMT